MQLSSTSKRIPAFDGLRAIAISSVLLHHLTAKPEFLRGYQWSVFNGRAGVRLFFVLSGFLIARMLLTELRERGSIELRAFWLRRFLRLAPSLILFLSTVGLLTAMGSLPGSYEPFLLSLLCLANFTPSTLVTPELVHLWSLSVEEQFYFLFPVFLKFKPHRWLAFVLAFIAICLVGRWLLEANPFGLTKSTIYWARIYTIPAADSIAIGCLLAWAVHHRGVHIPKAASFVTALGIGLLLLAPLWFTDKRVKALAFPLQSFGFAGVIAWLLANPNGKLASILSWAPLCWIGILSYDLYLWQGLFLRNEPGGELWIQALPQNLVLTFTVGAASYYLADSAKKRFVFRLRESLPPADKMGRSSNAGPDKILQKISGR